MNNKKKIITGILIFVIGLILVTGLSYAYFSANISGGEDATTITVTGGTMNIYYSGGADIFANNIIPSNNPFATKTFTVTGNNTTDLEMFYEVTLVVEDNTFSEEAIKYKLTGTNTDNNGTLIDNITELTNVGTGPKIISLGVGGFMAPTNENKVHTYNLELYFPETNENQNIDQGKSFKAHIETKSADKPIPPLRDSIIAQGGGIDAILAKGTPDFNSIAPAILTYKELTSTYTSSLVSASNKTIGTGYTFNETTGTYTLTNYETSQTYGTQHIGQYTCASTSYSNCYTMYKINEVTGTSITNATRYQYEINTYNYSDTGLFATEDEYGTSYYYRGDKETLNNNLIWAGFQWKIVRINGDGSIRLVYNGTEEQFNSINTVNSIGSNTQMGNSSWNSSSSDAKYVGYMFGGANWVSSTIRHGNTSGAATYNETSTNMKTTLDNWYKTNIVDKSHSEVVADNLFCNDRQLQSEVGGSSTGSGFGNSDLEDTYYAAHHRLISNKTPTLKCGLQNDRFTVYDTFIGNGSLTYPVGLLTADETSFAGLKYNITNSFNYLYTNSRFFLFAPGYMRSNGKASMFIVDTSGNHNFNNPEQSNAVRPAVSISSSVVATGTGSMTDPFKVS